MSILVDIGGTFVRFAVARGNDPQQLQKHEARDFDGLQEALDRYCNDQNIETGGALRIATAGYEDGGVWRFVNRNKWIIDPKSLEHAGWDVEVILNDFEASVWALPDLNADNTKTLKQGSGASATKCLLGPGTGLGLGYLHGGENPFVQKTHGGHMPVAAVSAEQCEIVQVVQGLKEGGGIAVFENFVSGPGLHNIYAALCQIDGNEAALKTPEDMLGNTDQPKVKKALRLFHEFFGIFAMTSIVSGHAYGGLYLTGGVLAHLIEAELFDFGHFKKWMSMGGVTSVTRDLQATPVHYITYPYPALKGLLRA